MIIRVKNYTADAITVNYYATAPGFGLTDKTLQSYEEFDVDETCVGPTMRSAIGQGTLKVLGRWPTADVPDGSIDADQAAGVGFDNTDTDLSAVTVQAAITELNALVATSGTTAQRPESPTTGTRYFDTTLGKPIWWNGSNWVAPKDAALEEVEDAGPE